MTVSVAKLLEAGVTSGPAASAAVAKVVEAVTTLPPPGNAVDVSKMLEEVVLGEPAPIPPSMVFLSWSDDRGHSFGNPVGIRLGDVGEYLTSLQWQRLGMGRDRVFQISWSSPVATALQGAWIDVMPAHS